MSALSDYLENALLDHVLRGVAYASPANIYVALFLSDPTDAGGGVEVAGGAYARRIATFGAPAGGVSVTTLLITFPVATADWGLITHIALFDALVAGNMLFHTQVGNAERVQIGNTYSIPAGSLAVALD